MAEVTGLVKKLALRPGLGALRLVNAPADFTVRLGDLPAGVSLAGEAAGEVGGVICFVRDRAEFAALVPQALAGLKYDGLCWLAFPKKSAKSASDLSRDIVWDLMRGSGLRPVMNIAIDEVWSALRFRPDAAVKSR